MFYGSSPHSLSKRAPSVPADLGTIGAWEGRVARHPLYDIELDPNGHLIIAQTRGVWSVEDTDRYFDTLLRLMSASRIRFGRARVLVDVTAAPVQSADVDARFTAGNALFDAPGDKLALVAGSSLQKMLIRPMLSSERTQVFASQAAALMWINAFP